MRPFPLLAAALCALASASAQDAPAEPVAPPQQPQEGDVPEVPGSPAPPADEPSDPPPASEPTAGEPPAEEGEPEASDRPRTEAPEPTDPEPGPEAALQAPVAETPAPRPAPQIRALVGATVIPGDGSPPIANGVVLLGSRRINAVGPMGEVTIPPEAEVIDVSGKWITPGLIDAHVHFMQSGGLYTRPDVVDLRSIEPYEDDQAKVRADLDTTFLRYLAAGVTAVFDPGGNRWTFDVRALADGARAPRVAVSGPLIATEPTPRQERLDLGGDPAIISAADADEARMLAQNLLPLKPDAIKIWGIGSGAEGIARIEEMTRAVKTVAAGAGIPVAVHATELATAKAAVRGGADILVHSVYDRDVDQDFISLLKESNTTYITTLVVIEGYAEALAGEPRLSVEERRLADPALLNSLHEIPDAVRQPAPGVLEDQKTAQRNAKALFEAGVRVALGTDAGNIGTLHAGSVHREVELLAEAGIAPLDIITMATQNAAYALTPNPDFGVIKSGYAADLLILKADPLADPANLAAIETVWLGGRPLERAAIIPPTPEAIVQVQLEAYNRQDLDAFAKWFAKDVKVYFLPGTDTARISGMDQFRAVYGELFGRPDEQKVRCDVIDRVVEGAFVIDQERCRDLEGRDIKARATVIYHVDGGKIQKVWFAQ